MTQTDRAASDPERSRGTSLVPLIAAISTVAAIAAHAIAYAPGMWQAAQLLSAEQVARENREFCTKLRMPPDTESFAICAGYLSEIRKRHADRLAADAAGVL